MKKQIFLLIGTILPLLLLTACGKKNESGIAIRRVNVETAKLSQHDFQHVVRVQGTVTPVDEATISARTSGNIDVLAVTDGMRVKKGQLLFQVDKVTLENKVTLARQDLKVADESLKTVVADLEITRTKLEKAQLDYNRAETLSRSKAISTNQYETAEVNLKNAKAEINKQEAILNYTKAKVDQRKVELSITEKNLSDSLVLAPYDGTVTEKFKEENEYVASGNQIIHIQNQAKMEAICYVSAVYYSNITVGKTMVDILFDNTHVCKGIVTDKGLNIEPLSRTFKIKVLLPENTPLVSGTLCNIDLILAARSGLGLPSDAVLLRKGGKHMAYIVRNEKAQAVDVQAGISSGGFTEVLNANSFKDCNFIVMGQYFVQDGESVSVLNAK